MPLTRYQIRNEYGLADPELYKAADRDDPEALLEGVAMAGLVGVLRQLGDLAEFAAEIFHDLHEEVMATATRGHGLVVRVQQLEADFPSIEKALLSQTNHSSFFSNTGVDWHPNLRSEQNMITRGDLPRFVMDSYEECRGPPRLFLLDKFDVGGAGACLKRYTDPSFFKVESASSIATVDMQRERKIRKVKHKKGSRWRNGETPEVALKSNAKLHELFLEERIENAHSDPARLVKLKKRHLNGSALDPKTGKSYMKKFVETPSPERKIICGTSVTPLLLRSTPDDTSEPELRILDISTVSPAELSPERGSASSSPDVQEAMLEPSMNGFNGGDFDGEIAKGSEPNSDVETNNNYPNLQEVAIVKQVAGDREHKTEARIEGSTPSNSDDMTSEVDNYMDALATMDSEMETDNEYKPKNNVGVLNAEKYGTDSDANEEEHQELQSRFSDSQSLGNSSTSDDGNNSSEKDRASFSHSDTLSTLGENTPSECSGAAIDFTSTETCGAEIFGQRSEIVEPVEATLKEDVVSHNTFIEEDITLDTEHTSRSAFVRETSPTLQHSDPGASLPVVSLAGRVLDETPSEDVKVGYRSLDNNEYGANLDDCLAVVPDDFTQPKDEFTNTSASHPVDESDVEDLGVSSDALSHLANVEELASEDQIGNNAVNEMLQTQCAEEDSTESFSRGEIFSPRLSISPAQEQLIVSALPEVQTSSVNSEVTLLVVDAAWSHSSEELYPVKDLPLIHGLIEQQKAPQTHGLIELQDAPQTQELIEQREAPQIHDLVEQQEASQIHSLVDQQEAPQIDGLVEKQEAPQTYGLSEKQFSGSDEDVPQLESISSVAGVPHYEDKFNVEERSRTLDDEELQIFTRDVDMEGGDTVSVEFPTNSPTYPGHEDHVISDDFVPETLHVETVAVPFAAVTQPDDDVNDVSHSPPNEISSPPRNVINWHESLSGFGDFHAKESELDEVVIPESVTNSEVQKEASEKEVVSPDSESKSSKSVTYDRSSSRVSDDGHSFSLVEQTENNLDVCDVTADSNPSKSITYEDSSSKVTDDGHNVSLDERTENSSAVCGITTTSTSSEMSHLESESQYLDQNDREDVVSSATRAPQESDCSLDKSLESQQVDMEYLPRDGERDQPEADLEQSLVFQSDPLDVECSQEVQASINSPSLQYAQIGSPNHMDKEISKQLPSSEHINEEICLDASSESCPQNLPNQHLTSEFLPESAGQELDDTKQTMETSDSTLPRLVPAAEATAVNLEDMPPLPPLPPMQWRIGRQLPSLTSLRESVGVCQDSFLPIQPLEADEKAQFDIPAPQRFDMPAPQRFNMPAPQIFDIPAPQREVCQPQDPFLPLTSLEHGKFQHVSELSMGNMVQLAPYSLHIPTVVNDDNYQNNIPDLVGTQFPNPFSSLSKVSDQKSAPSGESHFDLEGEKVQSSSNPFTVLGSECAISNHDPESFHGAIVQPLQQLPPETGLEPKLLQQSLGNSELEQGKLLATSGHNHLAVEGEKVQPSSNPVTVLGSECTTSRHDPESSDGATVQPVKQLTPETGLEPKVLQQSLENSELEQGKPLATSMTAPTLVDERPQHSLRTSEGETVWSSDNSAVMSDYEAGRSNGIPVNKLPRPRNPLIDAVTAHGQSKLRKVTERVLPEAEPQVDERDSLLQQIRTKSFNLKPATVTRPMVIRPSTQGPTTNLRVAAILEKANAIRQALAGSDEDDDDDSWSDS